MHPFAIWRDELQRQRCKVCWNADGFSFHVPDDVWSAVVPEGLQNHVVCLMCFDRFAAMARIDYLDSLGPVHFAGVKTAVVLTVTGATCNRS
jgi:hypothetical protein